MENFSVDTAWYPPHESGKTQAKPKQHLQITPETMQQSPAALGKCRQCKEAPYRSQPLTRIINAGSRGNRDGARQQM